MARDLVNNTGYLPAFAGADVVRRRQLVFRLPTSNVPDNPLSPVVNWAPRTTPAITVGTVASDGGRIVLAQRSSTATYYSDDGGVTWNSGGALPSIQSWGISAHAAGRYVILDDDFGATGATSPDGIVWTARTGLPNVDWQDITYGNGLFVAIAHGTTTYMTSPDGLTWTPRTLPITNSRGYVSFGGGLFMYTRGNTSTALVYTSPDGITWTPRTMPTARAWRAPQWGNGRWVVVSGAAIAATSEDGILWTEVPTPFIPLQPSRAFGDSVFCYVSFSTGNSMTSLDGLTWSLMPMPYAGNWTNMVYTGHGFFVAPGNGATTAALGVSLNG